MPTYPTLLLALSITALALPVAGVAQVTTTPPPRAPRAPRAPVLAPRVAPTPPPRAEERVHEHLLDWSLDLSLDFDRFRPDEARLRAEMDEAFAKAWDREEMRGAWRESMREALRAATPLAIPFAMPAPDVHVEPFVQPFVQPLVQPFVQPFVQPPVQPFIDRSLVTPAPRPFIADGFSADGREGERMRPRAPWLSQDPGDSLYRQARELLNGGEYRRAVASFRELATRMPTSGYAADAHYWWAFALYRIGGTDELRLAIEVLDTQKSKYPGARMLAQSDALSLRIRGALAARGDAASAAQLRTAAADSALRCDREEQSVRAEALNALVQADPNGAMPVLQKTLARKDECSATLRRSAVFLVGSRSAQPGAVALLSQVARTDPSVEVRASALEWLARAPGDDALATLEEVARDGSDEQVQRAAVRALVKHSSVRARQAVRALVERDATPERLRLEALGAFSKDRSTSDDIAWMRTLYGRTDNTRIRSRIVSTLSSIGGPDVEAWLLTMARNSEESSESRRYAIRRVGKTLPIVELGKLYDSSAERPIREVLIETLGQRPEGEATDKLLDIVKTGTDPHLRSRAISALSSKKDPRTLRLLMEIIDK